MTALKRLHRSWHRELAEFWKSHPITTCEVRFKNCFGTYGLAPAHSRRRFKIKTKEQYFEVVAACLNCHQTLDQKMSPEECEATVKQIIRQRELQIESF